MDEDLTALPWSQRQMYGLRTATTLARWQLGKVWRLLFLMGIGMIAAVAIACTLPLYSWVTLSGGLRETVLTPPAENAHVEFHTTVPFSNLAPTDDLQDQVTRYEHKHLGHYLDQQAQFSLISSALNFHTELFNNHPDSLRDSNPILLALHGQDIQAARSRLELIEGHLPEVNGHELQIALTPETASHFRLHLGSVVTLHVGQGVPLHLVGIVRQKDQHDYFWHHETLDEQIVQTKDAIYYIYNALIPNTSLLAALSTIPDQAANHKKQLLVLSWYYPLAAARLDAYQLNDLLERLTAAAQNLPALLTDPPAVQDATVVAPVDLLKQYRDHLNVSQVATNLLGVLVVALLCFFVGLLSELLVERQAPAVAIWRSRGASRGQIFAALLLQCGVLAIVGLLAGPLMAVLILWLLVRGLLSPLAQGALSLVLDQPLTALGQVWWLAILTVLVVLAVMSLALWQATQADILMLRQASGRTRHRPLWQRLYLDVLALLLALGGYGLVFYLTQSGLLDARQRILGQAPLVLMASVCILLAAALLFVRIFPWLLRQSLRLASRQRGVTTLLSLGTMARLPQHAVRMVLLLTFALTFAVFAQVFSASQSQHATEVARYQTGADFSGGTTQALQLSKEVLTQEIQDYRSLPGVTGATAGFVSYADIARDTSGMTPLAKVLAIDPDTFVDATIWSEPPSAQIRAWMKQLATHRADLQALVVQAATQARQPATNLALPALVDHKLAETLHLHTGQTFSLQGAAGATSFEVIGIAPTLPSVNDQAGSEHGEGGILIDAQSFASYYTLVSVGSSTLGVGPNYVWLRTHDDAQTLARVRASLSNGNLALAPLYDRRVLIEQLNDDPLYLNFTGVLVVGEIAPILLALVGNLLASWWNARSRASSFLVLRALGSPSSGLSKILLAEQALLYSLGIGLGILFGLLLSWLTLAQLVFTTVSTSQGVLGEGVQGNSFTIQNVPPVQILIPPALVLAVVTLSAICALALGVMIRTVTRPTPGQALRINED